jgi:hypothetical protein
VQTLTRAQTSSSHAIAKLSQLKKKKAEKYQKYQKKQIGEAGIVCMGLLVLYRAM